MRKLLIEMSGARPDVLEQAPTERGKFEGIGGAVLTTGVLAFLSMSFALVSALDVHVVLAVPIALLWGAIILSLDRWLVTTMTADDSRRFLMAIPRILIALLLGAVISTPLVLQIFRSEIDSQIVVIKQKRTDAFEGEMAKGDVQQKIATYESRVASLQNVINTGGTGSIDAKEDIRLQELTKERDRAQALADEKYGEWQCQLYGKHEKRSCKKGDGPLADASKAEYDEALAGRNELDRQIETRMKLLTNPEGAAQRVADARKEIQPLQTDLDKLLDLQRTARHDFGLENTDANGLLIRLEALDEVTAEDPTLRSAQVLLFLLFLLIECLPVAVKLMTRKGAYEEAYGLAVRDDKRRARKRRSRRHDPDDTGPAESPIRDIWHPDDDEPTSVLDDADLQEAAHDDDEFLRRMHGVPGGGASANGGRGTPLMSDDD
ncbi:DUF4407 domain-containing protein [Herbidospora sp. RD11066]